MDDHDLAENVIASIAGGKVEHTFRYRLMHKNGAAGWVEGFMRGYRDSPSGPVAGFVLTLHDIRTQKETEDGWSAEVAALADKNAHLATLAALDALTAIPIAGRLIRCYRLRRGGTARPANVFPS